MNKPDTMKYDLSMRMVKVLNVILITLPFAVCWYAAYADEIASPYYARGNYLIIALFAALYLIYGRVYEGFWVSMNPLPEIVYSQGLAALISNAILYIVTWLLSKHLPNPLPLLATLVCQVGFSAAWGTGVRRWYFRTWPPRRTLIIYDQREDMEQLLDEPNMRRKFHIVGRLNVQEIFSPSAPNLSESPQPLPDPSTSTALLPDFPDLPSSLPDLSEVDAVFLCGVHSHERNILLKECIAADVVAYITPRIGDVLMQSAHTIHMFHLPVMRTRRCHPDPAYLFLKRLMDIVFSLLALIVASPIMLATAIAIKINDGGPVFYSQRRLTKDGKIFLLHKFRSMRVDAEKDGVARLSTGDKDDRVTPVGRFIRKVRVDELPQLLNILHGDMSLVGPRPERPEIAEQYRESLPEFDLRLQVKAGLTGYAQVHGKYNTTPYDKLQMDLIYISNLGVAQDIRILFGTVKILFTEESTEGIKKDDDIDKKSYTIDHMIALSDVSEKTIAR